jgi:hypothetical protein
VLRRTGSAAKTKKGKTVSIESFDAFTKMLATGDSRRRAFKTIGSAAAAGALGLFGASRAYADPRTCVTCICGVGRPCNPKSTTCTEVRGFSAEQACTEACERANQDLCGMGNAFHCPHGCPS